MEGGDDDSSKNCFVTGSTGFLGCNIVEQLLIQGYRVYALYRSKRKVLELNSIAKKLDKQSQLILVKGDVTNYKSIVKGIPDNCLYVFHAAASIGIDYSPDNQSSIEEQEKQQYEINVNGTANVIEACIARGVKRLIHTGSVSTFEVDPVNGVVPKVSETTKKNNFPNMGYPRTKRIAELYIQDAIRRGLDAIIISPGFIIGRYDETSVGSVILMIAHATSPIIKSGGGRTNFSSAEEVAKAHITAAQVAPTGSEYCLGGNSYSWKELSEQVLFQLSIEKPVVQVSQLQLLLIGKKNDLMVKYFNHYPSSSTSKPITSQPINIDSSVEYDINKTTKAASISNPPPRIPYLSLFLAAVQTIDIHIDSSKAINQLNFKNQTLEYMVNDNIQWLKERNLL